MLTIVIGLASIPGRVAARVVPPVLLIVALAVMPSRYDLAQRTLRLPEYAALVRGSVEIRRHTPEVFQINVDFDLPYTAETDFLYTVVLGGRVTPSAPYVAWIDRTGQVSYRPAPRPQ